MKSHTIFSLQTGKVVGDTKNQSKVDYINKTYKGVMAAMPHDDFRKWAKQQREDGVILPFTGG